MKSILSVFLLAWLPLTSFSQELSVLSRNMPETCQYVYRVESDLRIELPLNSIDNEVIFQFQNAWKPDQWTSSQSLKLTAVSDRLLGEISLQTMSLPKNYLYRVISMTFPNAKLKCVSEFGREFGEACMPGGRSETPWRIRQVHCDSLP